MTPSQFDTISACTVLVCDHFRVSPSQLTARWGNRQSWLARLVWWDLVLRSAAISMDELFLVANRTPAETAEGLRDLRFEQETARKIQALSAITIRVAPPLGEADNQIFTTDNTDFTDGI